MFSSQILPLTKYDIHFTLLKTPFRIHPLFWLTALLIGSSGNLNVLSILVWIVAILIAILIHEFGHVLAYRYYGLSSQVVLHFAGGFTVADSTLWGGRWAKVELGPKEQIVVSLAGPIAGFLFAGLITLGVVASGGSILMTRLFGLVPLPGMALLPFGGWMMTTFLTALLWISVFWGLINLLPIHSFDGGNVMRNILLQTDPVNGIRKSLWVSVITGAIMVIVALVFFQSSYTFLLFLILTLQSYQLLKGRF